MKYLSDCIKRIDLPNLLTKYTFGKNVPRPTFELMIIQSTDRGGIMSEDTEDFYFS